MKFVIKKVKITKDYFFSRQGVPNKRQDKLYIWPTKESLMESIANRRSRPYNLYKEFVIPAVIERIAKEFPKHDLLSVEKWSWSQKCGCSMCPCSPGFNGNKERVEPYTIHVDIEFQ